MAGYETTYATKRRAIFRWQAIGRAKNDPPPLNNPPAMLAWWGRCMTNRAPAKLLALSEAEVASGIQPASIGTPSTPPAADNNTREKKRASAPVDFTNVQPVTLEAAVDEFRMQLAVD